MSSENLNHQVRAIVLSVSTSDFRYLAPELQKSHLVDTASICLARIINDPTNGPITTQLILRVIKACEDVFTELHAQHDDFAELITYLGTAAAEADSAANATFVEETGVSSLMDNASHMDLS